MVFSYSRFFRIISSVVLAFFLWTFGGLFDIAYAIKSSVSLTAAQNSKKEKKPEEKLNNALDEIKAILDDTAIDTDAKKNKLKTKKAAIDALDTEIMKQFKETEDKIKNLPDVIKKRHRDFIKHYETNLNELKINIDAIDKAKTKPEADVEVEKAKKHLEKIKPPKKYRPLDPNKLPHRTVKEKEVAVEEWVPPKRKKRKLLERLKKKAGFIDEEYFENYQTTTVNSQPILVASNGSLDGLLSSDSFDEYSGAEYIELAQAGISSPKHTPPTDADLAETIEIQFTPAILSKAEELQHHPVKIFNWVRNNIEFVTTYGSIQGADYCLQTKLCNAFDTASLTIALLRASGIHARYVTGKVEIPIEKVMNWVGGFTDKMAALNLLASGGIPTGGLTVGGEIKYA
jgi:hypothetical protein